MIKKLRYCGLIIVCSMTMTGCITHEETIYRDKPRIKVAFENDTAARIFYENLDQSTQPGQRTESTTHIDIPVVFDHKTKVIQGPNYAFNDAVTRCDTNGDGTITEKEARIYAEHKHKR
jgi:hypothetical protein